MNHFPLAKSIVINLQLLLSIYEYELDNFYNVKMFFEIPFTLHNESFVVNSMAFI